MNQSEPVIYKATGLLKGQYFPSTKFRTGILVTPDGNKLACNISAGKVAKFLRADSSLLESQQTWLSYPRVGWESSGLEFDLIDLYHKPERLERLKGKVDYFTIAGEVQSVDESTVTVCIRRNLAPPTGQEHWKIWQPSTLTIQGRLPDTEVVGKFWNLTCLRSGDRLGIVAAELIGNPPQPHQFSNPSQLYRPIATTTTAAPQVKSEQTNKPTKTPLGSPRPTIAPQPTIQKGDDMAISGKLEITIKINAFPDDVKTTQNAWKSFDIDCDGQLVTITVKPKVFKKLEDAQANYPMWVAAITGKMGARTPDGFVLDSPSISTFERRPKESAPAPAEAVESQ